MISEKKRFDEADKLTLRCLMRRFGWEKNSQCSSKSSRCLWAETFQNSTVKEYKDFAWFLVEELLHPWCATDIQRSHWPEDIHRARNGAEGVHTDVVKLHSDLLLWQAENECTKLPHRGQDAALSRRIERYLTESKLHSKEKLERAFALESLRRGSLSMSAEKCPHMDGVPDRGEAVPWRSEFERDLMFQIPGWCEESLPKESFVPTVEMLPTGTNPVAVEVLQYLGDARVSFDRKLLAVARKLGCAADWLHVSEALSKLLLHQYIDDSEILDRYNCRLCGFGCGSEVKFLEHLESTHAASMSKQRAMVEYRKKVLGMSAFAEPTVAWTMVLSTFWYSVVCLLHEKKTIARFGDLCFVSFESVFKAPSFSMQRCLAANFDEELRTPGGKELPREEGACVVCARRFWKHELVLLRLFQDPEVELPEDASKYPSVSRSQHGRGHRVGKQHLTR